MTLLNLLGHFGHHVSKTASTSSKDGIVDGTDGADNIVTGFQDADGDKIDGIDAILGHVGPDDDIVDAGAGDDIIQSGLGDDTIFAGGGRDVADGGSGDDLIFGDSNFAGDRATDGKELAFWSFDDIKVYDEYGHLVSYHDHDHPFNSEATAEDVDRHGVQDWTMTLDSDGSASALGVTDNDSHFNEGEDGQISTTTVSGLGKTVHPGDDVEPEYAYSIMSSSGDIIDIYAVELGDDDMVGLVSDKPLEPGETYTFYAKLTDKPSVSYSDLAQFEPDVTAGEEAADDLFGGIGNDTILGEGGNDTVDGGSGNDQLSGGDGNDSIIGGTGNDLAYGGAGDDVIGMSCTDISVQPLDVGGPAGLVARYRSTAKVYLL